MLLCSIKLTHITAAFEENFVPVPSNWFHFAIVIKGFNDGEGYEAYVNGNLTTSHSNPTPVNWRTGRNVSSLGATVNGEFFENLMADDLMVFSEALDADHVQMLANVQ